MGSLLFCPTSFCFCPPPSTPNELTLHNVLFEKRASLLVPVWRLHEAPLSPKLASTSPAKLTNSTYLPQWHLADKRPSTQSCYSLSRVSKALQVTSECSVSLMDIFLPILIQSSLPWLLLEESQCYTDLENLKARVHKVESKLASYQSIQPIACILSPDATCYPSDLAKASLLIDKPASDISR
ncbi:hypothetical protein CSKR_106806 [Clonorchis sinensis]|uniref:Uncharacterized protein n=1 Tax=Clonorchis sinensis TaxID=79923 RepID=A0A3R7JQ34_CLOSI|nr:hypothetical protein CSKR_106806 [Clonorchis sinensis]